MSVKAAKTSTLTIHHDRCDPSKWTLSQWRLLQDFIREPLMQRAARLSSLGIQLILSEHHKPKGGVLESVGWADEREMPSPDSISDDLTDILHDELEVTPIVEIYRGPTQYAVRFATGDDNGEFDGYEVEVKETEAEARAFLDSLQESEDSHASGEGKDAS